MLAASQWTALEITKLAVSVLTPLLLLGIGLLIRGSARRIEDAQWANRKLIERRLALYEEMAPQFNALYCFFNHVGNFREITPPALIQLKRALDKSFHVNKYLFSVDFRAAYDQLILSCFKTNVGAGRDAQVRGSLSLQQREVGSTWDHSWDPMFVSPNEATSPRTLNETYERLMDTFAAELDSPAPLRD